MRNRISHHRLTIEFDVWEPKIAKFEKDLDSLVMAFKTGQLLGSVGNLRSRVEEVKDEPVL